VLQCVVVCGSVAVCCSVKMYFFVYEGYEGIKARNTSGINQEYIRYIRFLDTHYIERNRSRTGMCQEDMRNIRCVFPNTI